ncbi:hypothetical protein [Streptomyces sp. 8N706]|uniref:hypothetical protein n=1 Tax=Streptomyces sp. 8N706 TaxID=3457416 RepID=UPI003FD10176
MNYTTQHLMDLAALARTTTDAQELTRLLRGGSELYHQGLEEMRHHVSVECAGLTDAAIAERCRAAGAPWPQGCTREEAVAQLSFHLWDATPAAMSFTFIAEHAAQHGVSLLPEE